VQLLLLLVFEGTSHNSNSFIANLVAAKIQLTNCLTTLKHSFEFMQAVDSDVIFAKSKDFQIALFTKSATQGQSALWEDSITRKPNLCNVLCVL